MAERSNAAVLKTVDPKGPGVRIPLSPQNTSGPTIVGFLFSRNPASLLAKGEGEIKNTGREADLLDGF